MKDIKASLSVKIPFTIKKADTFRTRLKGLMFRKAPFEQEGLWLIPYNFIHMCFMNFPIDVVFLDKNKMIIKLVENLQPWKFLRPVTRAHSTLEIPSGSIQQLHLKIGQYVEIQERAV